MMEQEDKELLIKDLCARLPYRVKVKVTAVLENMKPGEVVTLLGYKANPEYPMFCAYRGNLFLGEFKPYLRPMSSMTEEDIDNLNRYIGGDRFIFENGLISVDQNFYQEGHLYSDHEDYVDIIDWLNSHHFDYRGLIEKGLALEAPKGMYEIN